MIPGLFYNFKRALIPLMHDETYDAMNRVQDLVEANSYATKVKNTLASKQLQKAAGVASGAAGNDEDDDYALPELSDGASVKSPSAATGTETAVATVSSGVDDKVVEGILNATPTCEPGSRYCAPCYELA